MAGRGRGQLTFSVEIIGIGKGENLPPSCIQPTPVYPPLEQKPVPLQTGEEAEYMLALKQEFRGAMRTLPFYIRPTAPKKDVERYSDKYQKIETSDILEWKPDWRRFPKELRVRETRPSKDNKRAESPAVPKKVKGPRVDKVEIMRKLETLEQKEKEGSSDEEDAEKKKPEEEEADGEEVYDEEEFEDGTDYAMSYFDNGEEFGGDSDDNMDEAVY